ncbi:MAG: hypothetical protein ACYTGX_17840 [Planctomycetota bacterium]|jgi:hypothetical protein
MNRVLRSVLVGGLVVGCFAGGAFLNQGFAQSRGLAGADNGMSNIGGMSAVTGRISRTASALYVVDHAKKQLAVYHAIGGRDLQLVSARRIKYDLELRAFQDRSERRVDVRFLRELFRRQIGKQGAPDLPPPRKRK